MSIYPRNLEQERGYNVERAAQRMRISTRGLVERIKEGKVEVQHNGHYNYVLESEIKRVSGELREEAKAFQAAEDKRKADEQRERDGYYIAREMEHLRQTARDHGFDPDNL